jgi:hypothetical protein
MFSHNTLKKQGFIDFRAYNDTIRAFKQNLENFWTILLTKSNQEDCRIIHNDVIASGTRH